MLGLRSIVSADGIRHAFQSVEVAERTTEIERYFSYLDRLGVADWVRLDLSIVRGLDYYTGIVFELFDTQKELRAICGGGRYDSLLGAVGGSELPALGFGMGDVVLTELLRDRGLNVSVSTADFWVAAQADDAIADVMTVSTALRRAGASVEYALRKQQITKQKKAAISAGASYFLVLQEGFVTSGAIRVDELLAVGSPDGIDRTGSRLMTELANRPSTLESLLTVLRAHPDILA